MNGKNIIVDSKIFKSQRSFDKIKRRAFQRNHSQIHSRNNSSLVSPREEKQAKSALYSQNSSSLSRQDPTELNKEEILIVSKRSQDGYSTPKKPKSENSVNNESSSAVQFTPPPKGSHYIDGFEYIKPSLNLKQE